MASKLAHQSLNEQQNDEVKALIDRKKEIQKQINQSRLILKDHHDANLKQKKSCRRKNPQMAQLEQKLSKLKADLKEVEHAISEKGSTTNSVEVEQKPPQDSVNDIGNLQEVNSSASEETEQSESENFVSKDENVVIRPACRKCNRFIEKLLEDNMRFIKQCKGLNEENMSYIKQCKDLNEAEIRSIEKLQQKNQQIEDLQIMLERKDNIIEDLDEQLDTKQKLLEKLQQNDTCSKELINKLETLENELSKRQKLEEKLKMDEDVILKLENKNKQMARDMDELNNKLETAQ